MAKKRSGKKKAPKPAADPDAALSDDAAALSAAKTQQAIAAPRDVDADADADAEADGLVVRRLCGYVALSLPRGGADPGPRGWVYLRRHGESQLFIGNVPWPSWLQQTAATATAAAAAPAAPAPAQLLDAAAQTRLQPLLRRFVPGATAIEPVFVVASSLATRLTLRSRGAVDEVLRTPGEHVHLPALLSALRPRGKPVDAPAAALQGLVARHEAARDAAAVQAWSNAAVQAFELREAAAARARDAARARAGAPDADGFVTVTDGAPQVRAAELRAAGDGDGMDGVGGVGGSGFGRKKGGARRKKKKNGPAGGGVEKSGFYRWQRGEREGLARLRDEFRADRRRVAALQALGGRAGGGGGGDAAGSAMQIEERAQ